MKKNSIVIDLRFYDKYTGIGLVSMNMYKSIQKEKFKIITICSQNLDFVDESTEVIKIKGKYGFLNSLHLYFILIKLKPKYLIFPHYFVSAFVPKNIKVISFVHDIMAISHKDNFWKYFATIKSLILKYYLKVVLKNAELLVPSYSVKNDVLKHLNYESIVMPNGSNYIFNKQDNKSGFLFVGNNRKHKNLSFLLELFTKLSYQLTIVSGQLNNTISNVQIKSKISEVQLKGLYANSIALIIPSCCEGFGIPIIDSCKIGTKVIASRIDIFKEFYGLNITYFNPQSENDLKNILDLQYDFKINNIFSTKSDDLDIFNWNELTYYLKNLT